MPIYVWKAKTRQGALKKGQMDATSEAAVLTQLRAQSLIPVTVKGKAKDLDNSTFPFLNFLRS